MLSTEQCSPLFAIRKPLGLSQAEMAHRMGMKLRAYSDLETGARETRQIHVNAAERVALAVAVERGNPMLAPAEVRKQALEVARLITGV
jgi:transcriptional regulator with XRE-family HTH domain